MKLGTSRQLELVRYYQLLNKIDLLSTALVMKYPSLVTFYDKVCVCI